MNCWIIWNFAMEVLACLQLQAATYDCKFWRVFDLFVEDLYNTIEQTDRIGYIHMWQIELSGIFYFII